MAFPNLSLVGDHLPPGKATVRPVRLQVATGRDDICRPLRCPDGRLSGGQSSGLAGRPGLLFWITDDDSHENMTLRPVGGGEYVPQTPSVIDTPGPVVF